MTNQEQELREAARVALLRWMQVLDPQGSYIDEIADVEPCGRWNFDDLLCHCYEMNQ